MGIVYQIKVVKTAHKKKTETKNKMENWFNIAEG